MAKPWSSVEQSEEYQSLPLDQQMLAKDEYFNTIVSSKDEFKNLPEEDQFRARTEFFGIPENQPISTKEASKNRFRTMLETPMQERMLSGSIGGVPIAVAGGEKTEEALPIISQIIGSSAGFPGAVAGAAYGIATKEIISSIREKKKPDFGNIALQIGETAAIEGLFRGTGKLFFRREFANLALKSMGTALGKIKDSIRNLGSEFSIPKSEIFDFLETTLGKTAVPMGKVSSVLKKWKIFLKRSGEQITPRQLVELEDDLGEALTYAKGQRVGGITISPEVRKPFIEFEGKKLRSLVSSKVEEIAKKAGFANFGKLSTTISKLKKKFPESSLRGRGLTEILRGQAIPLGAGALVGVTTGDPKAGILTGLGLEAVQSPAAREALFKAFIQSKAGRGITLGSSELARRVSES